MVNLGTIGELIVVIRADDAEETNRQIAKVQDTTKKAGQESKRQIPVLERMGKRWGAVLGLVAASGAVAFGLILKSTPAMIGALKGMQLGFESIFNVIGEELAPVFELFTDIIFKLAEAFYNLDPFWKTFIAYVVAGVIVVSGIAAAVLGLAALWPILATAGGTALTFLGIGLAPLFLIIGAVVLAGAFLAAAWKHNLWDIQGKVKSFVTTLRERWAFIMRVLNDDTKTTTEKIKILWLNIVANVKRAMTGLKVKLILLWFNLKDKATDIFGAIKDIIVGKFEDAKASVVAILDSIKAALRNTINYFKDNPITKFIKRVTTSVSPSSMSGTSARANGGPVASGTQYLVGELGPELFTPNVSGAIIPNNKLSGAQSGASGGTQAPINLNVNLKLDGRTVWQSVQKYSTAELRRMGV